MAQRDYTINLKDATFPMLSEQQERTIIGGASETGTDKADYRSGVFYCHNIMPTDSGLDSVGYLSVIAAYAPATVTFSDVRIIYGDARTRLYLAFDSDGGIYILDQNSLTWIKLILILPLALNVNDITIATVNGISYIFFKQTSCYLYNETTEALESVTLTGLTISTVLGLVASYGYLIAYTDQALAWSSTIDPTDFVPSTATGAGGGNVAGIGGAMKFCISNSLGILVYTETNVIAATYTGNVQYPFKFREVNNSKGGISLDLVAYEANSANQFVYSKAGLQSIGTQKADNILPEATDFLAGKRLEDFDEVTKDFTITDLTTTMQKKVKFIASRYLIISYGVTSFTHALVYDADLKRLGKLKLTHTDCFEYVGEQVEVSKESIAFLLPTGEVQVLDFSVTAESNGVVILGKLQYTRNKMITLQGVNLENIQSGDSLTVTSLVSADGKTTTKTDLVQSYSVNNLREYSARITAVNHSLLIIGKFNLTTIYIIYNLAGRR